ncbi:polysaccharide biosynthesis tyrosine autokinase [Motilimonas sp. 1_MG-2023]|uniref:GumC family protein n=1 Tax=Motilimonas sp. 1_MG-2023 TaxID=3062672 RepID=UPI0026E20710|nr:polysaccharide biosynthesis tyrosine autokinase [Motilimonas sp. 1_MG-2023]MDO6524316.1 polysaccharide biosynthesis tyrosine autokinase [Motilimonas sp. 1_MG-2023]
MEQKVSAAADKPQMEQLIDIKQIWLTLLKYKWSILFFSLIVTVAASFVAKSKPSIYTATATLLIESKQAKAVSVEEVYGLDTRINEYFYTQFEILKSDSIALAVIRKMDLINHPEFNPELAEKEKQFDFSAAISNLLPFLNKAPNTVNELSTEENIYRLEQRVLGQFKQKLSIAPVRKTQLVDITFNSYSPELAAQIANEVGNVYIESNLDATLQVANKASGWLNDRLATLKAELQASESKLQNFLKQEGLVDIAGVGGLASQELNELTSQLNIARDRRVAAESLYNLAQSSTRNVTQVSAIPEISNHPVIRDVKLAVSEAERKISDLTKRYGPKHPKMKAAEAELASAKVNLDRELRQLVKGIGSEVTAARQAENSIRSEIESRKAEFQDLTVKTAKYSEFQREVDSNKQLYDLFLNRYKETSASSDFGSTIARFTDEAHPPLFPSAPNRKLIIVMAFVVSFGFACVVAFVLEALNDTFVSAKQVESTLGVSLLGVLPLVKAKKNKVSTYLYYDEKQRAFSEGVRTIRTSYMLSNMNNDNQSVIVTSSEPNEGKTTSAINLAFGLAQLEKTILIDCDLRRPTIGRRFELSAAQPGLANLIAGTHTFEECLVKDEVSGLDILSAGLVPSNPQELLASERFTMLLDKLKQRYSKIVLDTPPCLAVSDAYLLSQKVDSCILVTRAEHTRTGVVKQTLAKLVQQGIKIDGVILNRLNLKKAAKYGGHGNYHEYYGYAEKTKLSPVKQKPQTV